MAFEEKDIEIVAINDLSSLDNFVYLLKRDTVYGGFQKNISQEEKKEKIGEIESKGYLVVDNKKIYFFQEKEPKNLPWQELGIDVVIESTGVFEDYQKAKDHLLAGAKKVIISAPAKGEEKKDGRMILIGINEEEKKNYQIISNGSCTTNAVSPVMAVLEEKIGIKKAILNTIHAYTATQSLVDGISEKDFLWEEPHITLFLLPLSSEISDKVLNHLENKFDGLALRVPVVCGSIADITFISQKKLLKKKLIRFKEASVDPRWQGILGISKNH